MGFALPTPLIPSNYIHEFGHFLGLSHEIQNPNAKLNWNRSFMYADLAASAGWSKEEVDQYYFAGQVYPGSRPFDPSSIMMVPVKAGYLEDGKVYTMGLTLSDSDKKYIATLYPK